MSMIRAFVLILLTASITEVRSLIVPDMTALLNKAGLKNYIKSLD